MIRSEIFLQRYLHVTLLQRNLHYFVTTPIFYVNAAPHIGHLHSAVLADAMHRVHCLLGADSSLFATGTDEHGLKIQKAADNAKKLPLEFCNLISAKYQKLFDDVDIGYTDFIRTTEVRHKEAVAHFWRCLKERKNIYKGTYEGWYSTADEAFLSHVDVTEGQDGMKISKESGQQVEWTKEDNYMFKLSAFEKDLKYWIDGGAVQPNLFGEILKRMIDEGLADLSISRQRSRLHWGIPVPDDDTQTIYVWLDALVNYLTVAGYPKAAFHWPPDCHVIGKDILKFHGIYWPAFLIGAGLEPPRKLFCHSHWTVNDEKMSKSKGNIVDPFEVAKKFTFEGLRYFLLRAAVPHSDANFTEAMLQRTVNAELADTFGNLLSRCVAPAINRNQTYPKLEVESFQQSCNEELTHLIERVKQLPGLVQGHFLEGNFHRGLEIVMTTLHMANAFVQTSEPWRLVKVPQQEQQLANVLHVACETVRVCATLMQPIVPQMSTNILDKLAVPSHMRLWTGHEEAFPTLHNKTHPIEGVKLGTKSAIVFQRVK